MSKRSLIWIVVAVLASLTGFAQDARPGLRITLNPLFSTANQPEIPVSELETGMHFLIDSASLQYAKPSKLLRYAAYPALGAGALTASYLLLDHDLRHDLPNDESKFKDFISECAEPLGRSVTITPGFGALMAYGLVANENKARQAAAIGLAAFYLNDGVTTQLKKGFSRMRPSTGAHYYEWFAGEPHRSFPSSHTSSAFSAATVLASVYKDKKLVAPIAYGVATVVGFSRLYHNQHWASDVVGGAIVGYLTAKATYFAYNFLERKWKNRKQKLVLLPQVNPNGFSATAVVSF